MLNSLHYLKYMLGLAAPMTETTEMERVCLQKNASGKNSLAEIGCFHGVNTRVFREVMSSDGVLIAVDPYFRCFFGIRGFGWARRIAHKEVGSVKNGSILWVEDLGERAPTRSDVKALLPVDFLFIDGNHSYEGLRGDWLAWKSLISKGGVVALHDSLNRNGCGSQRYTEEVILKDTCFECIEQVDSLTVLRCVKTLK